MGSSVHPSLMAEAEQASSESVEGSVTEYEFSESENKHFAALGWSMRYAGLGWFLACMVLILLLVESLEALQGASGFVSIVASALAALFLIMMGFSSFRASGYIFMLVRTEGHDISHLVRGLDHLRRIFSLQTVLAMVLAVAGISLLAWLRL